MNETGWDREFCHGALLPFSPLACRRRQAARTQPGDLSDQEVEARRAWWESYLEARLTEQTGRKIWSDLQLFLLILVVVGFAIGCLRYYMVGSLTIYHALPFLGLAGVLLARRTIRRRQQLLLRCLCDGLCSRCEYPLHRDDWETAATVDVCWECGASHPLVPPPVPLEST